MGRITGADLAECMSHCVADIDLRVSRQREYTFDQFNVLAKEKEEEYLRDEMRRDAVQQILRQLAAFNK